MTAVVEDNVRSLVLQSRAEGVELVIITNSGSQYILTPLLHKQWKIVRVGCEEGHPTVHYGPLYHRNGELVIGPWRTTGLSDVFVMD